jgi:hypothetical protein
LAALDLSECHGVAAATSTAIGARCGGLRSLRLAWCVKAAGC